MAAFKVNGTLPILQRRKQKFLETDLLVSSKAGSKPKSCDTQITWSSRLPPATCAGRGQGLASDLALVQAEFNPDSTRQQSQPASCSLETSLIQELTRLPRSSLSLQPVLFLRLRKC